MQASMDLREAIRINRKTAPSLAEAQEHQANQLVGLIHRIARLPALERRCEELEDTLRRVCNESERNFCRHLRTVQAARKAIRYWRQRCGAAEAYIEILEELVGVWRIENGLCGATCQDARAAHQRAKERR